MKSVLESIKLMRRSTIGIQERITANDYKVLSVVFVVALLVRLFFVGFVHGFDATIENDEGHYDALGWHLVTEGEFRIYEEPTVQRMPFYPLFIAGIYLITGHSLVAVRLTQAVLGAILCCLIYIIGKKTFNHHTSILAAFLAAIYPYLVFWTGFLYSENLFVVLVAASVLCLIKTQASLGLRPAFASGVLLGLAILTRPPGAALIPLTICWLLISVPNLKLRFYQSMVLIGTATIIMIPWVVRNFIQFEAFIPFTSGSSSGSGYVFWMSNNSVVLNNSEHWGRYVPIRELPHYDELIALQDDPQAFDRKAWELGFEFLRDNPQSIPKLILGKFIRFWNFLPRTGIRDQIFGLLSLGWLLPFFAVGFVGSLQRWRELGILYLTILVFMGTALIFWADARMRYPIEPYILLFGAYGISLAWDWLALRWNRKIRY